MAAHVLAPSGSGEHSSELLLNRVHETIEAQPHDRNLGIGQELAQAAQRDHLGPDAVPDGCLVSITGILSRLR